MKNNYFVLFGSMIIAAPLISIYYFAHQPAPNNNSNKG